MSRTKERKLRVRQRFTGEAPMWVVQLIRIEGLPQVILHSALCLVPSLGWLWGGLGGALVEPWWSLGGALR